jgi:hypothetical protein
VLSLVAVVVVVDSAVEPEVEAAVALLSFLSTEKLRVNFFSLIGIIPFIKSRKPRVLKATKLLTQSLLRSIGLCQKKKPFGI